MLDVPQLQPLLNPVSYLREDLVPGVGQLQEELVARPGEDLQSLVLHPAPPDTEGSSLQHPTSGSTLHSPVQQLWPDRVAQLVIVAMDQEEWSPVNLFWMSSSSVDK